MFIAPPVTSRGMYIISGTTPSSKLTLTGRSRGVAKSLRSRTAFRPLSREIQSGRI